MTDIRPNERENVLNLQRYLRQLSFDYPSISPLPLDGIFDTATRQALSDYQRMVGLEQTGQADPLTLERLFEDYLASVQRNTRGNGFYIFPRTPPNYAVYPDENHFLVQVIQYMLNELRVLYGDIPLNAQNGVYDEATRQGVLEFQRRHNLPQNDRVDLTTWNAMTDAFRRLYDRYEQ